MAHDCMRCSDNNFMKPDACTSVCNVFNVQDVVYGKIIKWRVLKKTTLILGLDYKLHLWSFFTALFSNFVSFGILYI